MKIRINLEIEIYPFLSKRDDDLWPVFSIHDSQPIWFYSFIFLNVHT
jgi:hypothetical protein